MQKLIVKLGDNVVKDYVIDKDVVTIGRGRDNEIVIENLSVSRNHARLRRESGKFILIDLNSANGSFVNGVRTNKTELLDGDIISVGKHRIYFVDTDTAGAREALARATEEMKTPSGPIAPPPQEATPPPAKAPRKGKPAPATVQEPAAPQHDDESRRVAAAISQGKLVPAVLVSRGKQEGHVFRLEGAESTIGRHGTDIRLHDWHVAKRHAVITHDGGLFTVRDLGSWQGTVLNGEKVKAGRLHDGDELIFGGTALKFRLVTPEELAKLGPKPTETADFTPQAPAELPVTSGQRATDDVIALTDLSDTELPVQIPAHLRVPTPPPTEEPASAAELAEDDEFAPMTDEELAALEEEADHLFAATDDLSRQAEWEQKEAERLMAEGGGLDMRRGGVLIEDDGHLRAEEERFVKAPDAHELAEAAHAAAGPAVEQEDAEEEAALFGGPIPDAEAPAAKPARARAAKQAPTAAQSPIATPAKVEEVAVPDGVDPKEFRRWSRGLRNRSKLVRREAARKLKELTGIDYEWESEPE